MGEYTLLLKAQDTIRRIREHITDEAATEALAAFARAAYQQGREDGLKEARKELKAAVDELRLRLKAY